MSELLGDHEQARSKSAHRSRTVRRYRLGLTGARGFLLVSGVNGPSTPVDVPGAPRTAPAALNDRGQIVGLYENPNAQPAGPTDQ